MEVPLTDPRRIVGVEGALQEILTDLDCIKERMASMPTKAELDSALARLQEAVTDRIAAVSAKLADMGDTLARFQAEDATEDADYQAQIATLHAELDAQLAEAVDAVNAMADAVSGADASPEPAPATE